MCSNPCKLAEIRTDELHLIDLHQKIRVMIELQGRINCDERFVRWQTVLREHLTNMNNLFLTIAIGGVGFLVSILKEPAFNPVCCEKLFFSAGLTFLFLSVLTGIATGLSRLRDFRATVEKIKAEYKGDQFAVIDDLKEIMELYGKYTWRLFYTQIGTLTLGIVLLVVAFGLMFFEKLF